MKKLTEAQDRAVKTCVNSIAEYGSALNSSKTSTGKTVMGTHVAMRMNCPVAVIAPKAVLPHWRKEMADHGIIPLFVTNYEKIRRGLRPYLTKTGERHMKWDLPEGTLIIFDEVQRCKNPFTLNSLLLITARMQRANTLLLSATAAEDCTEMRAIGYALGLHSLNNSTATHLSWQKWMLKHGCWQDQWKAWRSGPKSKLAEVHEILYRDRAVRLTEADMPEAFRENLIIEEPVEFDAHAAIKRFYRENRITPAIIDAFIEKSALPDDAKEDDDPVLVKMLRARQLAEAVKIPDIVDMARDLEEEGRSVVVFLNFRESALAAQRAIADAIKQPVSLVIGGQSAEERSANVQAFSDDRVHVIVCTTAAGGTGLDGLQDLRGDRPRVSLISPSFSAQEFRQVLGRLPRAYAKSGVQQRILIAVDTIEEYVLKAIHRKLANLEALHGK